MATRFTQEVKQQRSNGSGSKL